MQDEFDRWHYLKKKIDARTISPNKFPMTGDIWVCSIGKNIGSEQNGRDGLFSRPVLIVQRFGNEMFWCVPLSSKQKDSYYYFNFVDPNNRHVSLLLQQMKLMSIKRLERKLYSLNDDLLSKVRTKLKSFL